MAYLSPLLGIFAFFAAICLPDAQNIYRLLGSSVELKCPFKAGAGESLIWEKDYTIFSLNDAINPDLPPNLRNRLSITGNHTFGEYHLSLANITKSDGGIYECSIRGSGRFTLNQYILYSIDEPVSVDIENVSSGKLLGTEGQNLTVSCTANGGVPVPNVTLAVAESLLASGNQSVQYTLRSVDRSYDGQKVTCTASNNPNTPSQRTDTAAIYLNLKPFLPEFIPNAISTDETRPFVLSCTTRGSRPAATFTWFLEPHFDVTSNSTQQTVYNTSTDTYTVTSTLTYRVDKMSNRRYIVCGARNTATTSVVASSKVLDVKYAPVVIVLNKTFQQTPTARIVECVLNGNPSTYTFKKWRHISKNGILIRELNGTNKLTLPPVPVTVQYQDNGEYFCTASNGVISMDMTEYQTGSGYVTSYGIPVFTKDNNGNEVQFGEFGRKKMLSVFVYSVPKYSSKRWYRGTTELTSSKYITSEEPTIVRDTFHGVDVQLDGYNVTLTITDLTQQDFANYTLRLYSWSQYVEYKVELESTYNTDNQVSVGSIIGGVFGGVIFAISIAIGFVIYTRYSGTCKKNTGEEVNIKRQYDNIGMAKDIIDNNYEEVKTKDKPIHTGSNAKTYETLRSQEKPNIYADLKTTGVGQLDTFGGQYEVCELQDRTGKDREKVHQLNKKRDHTNRIYENERF